MSYNSTTANLGLPQWILSDPPQMSDFNTAFSKIDEFAGPDGTNGGVARLGNNGAVPPSQGGTGQTTLQSSLSSLINSITPVQITSFQPGVNAVPTGGSSGPGSVNILQIGKIAIMYGSVSIDNATGEYQTLFTLPEGLAPSNSFFKIVAVTGNRIARIQANPNGNFVLNWIFNNGSSSAYTGEVSWLEVSMMWIIA